MDNIVEKVRRFVEEESKKPTNKYGYETYKNHFVIVVQLVKILSEKLHADTEVAELAAWLHDIGSIMVGRENHHTTGAEIAERKLRELNYPEEKIEKVKKCILNHRGSQQSVRDSIEEQIIADADAITAFDSISDLFGAAFVCETKDRDEARKSVLNKLINCWNKLSFQESKDLVKPKYEAAMLLLGETK